VARLLNSEGKRGVAGCKNACVLARKISQELDVYLKLRMMPNAADKARLKPKRREFPGGRDQLEILRTVM
jgi:hypothetical protein